METICDELGIPKQHVKETARSDRFILIVDKCWLKCLEQKKKIIDFPKYQDLDNRTIPELEHPWTKVHMQNYKKYQRKVVPLPKKYAECLPTNNNLPMTYSQMVSYVTNVNFRNLWEESYKNYSASHVKFAKQTVSPKNLELLSPLVPYDIILRELIQRMFNCCIIHSKLDRIKSPVDPNLIHIQTENHTNIMPALAAIETSTHISIIFYPPAYDVSLSDCITYSPAILNRSHNKPLFLIYQLFQLTKHLHDAGLLLGDLRLHDIYISNTLWLQIIPNLESNIIEFDMDEPSPSEEEFSESTKFDLKFAYDVEQFSLREYCEMWCNGQLSNFDYLTILNNATGRRIGSPEYHHIMPWVTDFSQRNGMNWRDLTKSKYRLNKGDPHLDLMFSSMHTSSSSTTTTTDTPHHVSDFLSEITYFVYMARRTPQHILCQHVRPIWVPAEYPVSIQRLQEWTPDECIPEFYSDPMVFKSIHEDLPDLDLPTWSSCPEDFIVKHREALESQYVSERLNYWIDLNFGYKLTGKAAIKSKNVCLSLVDNHKNLCQRGIVQLFTQPHPPKRFPSPWFGKNAPRISSITDQKRRWTQSIEDISSASAYPNTSENIVQSTGNMERSTSFYTNTHKSSSNTIHLPKDYNPTLLLQSLENMETFLARTFLSQKSDNCHTEKLANQDLQFEDSENSFTNQMFVETMLTGNPKNEKKLNKSRNYLVQQNKHKNVKQILREKRENELQVIGCIIIELFLLNKLRPLTTVITSTTFEQRVESCKIVAKNYSHEIPKCLRYAVSLLLSLDKSEKSNDKIIADKGLPPPTAHQILEPILSNLLIPFPTSYFPIYTVIKSLNYFDFDSTLLDLYTHIHCNGQECSKYIDIDRARVLFSRKIAECKVNAFGAQIENLLKPIAYEQFSSVELLLPHVIELLKNEDTSILTAWNLFDPIATALGIKETQKYLLEPILKLFDTDLQSQNLKTSDSVTNSIKFSTSSSFKSRKSVKLYHHSFLLRLIVRFGLKCFLDNFIPPLIEAVGGYKEPENSGYSNGLHYHSNRNTNFRSSRSNKNLKFCCSEESDTSLTLISPKSDRTLSFDTSTKPEVEDVFSFDDDVTDRIIDMEIKSVDSFEVRPTNAEEATEDGTLFSPEKQAFKDILYGSQNLSNNSFEDDTTSVNSRSESPHIFDLNNGPKSPTIAIPSTFRRTYELSTIDCEIGSKKSQDSFDFSAQITNNKDDPKSDATDSMMASMISKMSEEKASQNNRISEMSTESLIHLSQLLGPILTARYISRNLLRMLSLCYISQENLLPENYDGEECGNLNYFSIADSKVVGDRNAVRVLECLAAIVALFGEQFILLQYFPHVGELIALCRKRITPSLEGALISSLQLLKYMIPCLVDATIMEHLKDKILGTIISPIITVLGSTKSIMPSGYLGRSVLARKLLDTVYVLAIRIGPEMSKEHLCIPVIEKFFLIFDKAYGIIENFNENERKNEMCYSPPGVVEELENFDFHMRERAMEEIRDVFSPNLAHCSYLTFLRFFGESVMSKTLKNLEFVMTLCHEFEQPDFGSLDRNKRHQGIRIDVRRPSDEDFVGSNSFGTPVIGNRIDVPSTSSRQEIGPIEVLDMVASKFDNINTKRYLKGNWLAYWRHEISRSDKDNHMNLKQIKLQTFAGHTNSVRAILSLDNENSFMSASKDKTVKLWSLRSEGDGKKVSSCQFTYNSHKKSVHSLAFLESLRYVVSCDSGIHLWDPFIGRPLGILDSHKYSPVTVVRTFPSPVPLVLAGTAESSVKIMDCRTMEYVNEWRVTTTQSSTVRCLACAPSGHWVAVGLSSGNIVLLDGRTGIIMASWRATEGELLQLVAASDNHIISSSLDHSISVWNINDNSLQYQLKQPPEPAHCLQSVNSEIVFATPANRIGIYSDILSRNGTYTIARLRSETLKGMLTSLAVLPLNRTILTGNDSGNIVLLC